MSEAVMTTDAFSNPLFRLGYGSQSPLEATEYPLTRMTGNYALLNSLYRENWVVQNVVGIIPDDMTREWFTLGGAGPEELRRLEQAQRRAALRDRISAGLKWGRLYGGAAGILMIRGQEGMLDQPLDLDMVLPGTFAGIYIVDRWCGVTPDAELVSDMSDPDFGLPAYYRVNTPEGGIVARVHHSRVIRFTGRELPCLEKLTELHWGESEVEALYQDVVKHDNVSANMAALTFRANVETMEVENLDQLFSVGSAAMQRRFWRTMQAQSVMRSNFGMQLVNKGDQIRSAQYTFTGLQEVYESMCLNLSGASRIPVTKLFGRAPAGLNATGESDLRNYYDYVDTLRENTLRPILERVLPVVCMSAWGVVPEDLDIVFPPLWTPSAKEVAEIAEKKAVAIRDIFQAGLLQADTAQKELKKLADETGLFGSISDEEIKANKGKTYQDVTALRDTLLGLGYGGEGTGPFEMDTGDALALDYNPYHDPASGRFTSGGGSGTIGKTKYAPSPQRNHSGIQLKPKAYTRLCGVLGTRYPGLKAGEVRSIRNSTREYLVRADGYGGFTVIKIRKLK
ncbi:MAG: DUF1073 domain-containing protein [Oscillospiraceae bacterium]|nr:DUF1073 domain-containing protein [Oscillospiraceae bacterium]